MKIFQVLDGRAHWLTPYRSTDELYVDVEQEGGKIERQRRYPETDVFAEAPEDVQEGWVYLGGGKFRSDEPERAKAELAEIDAALRHMYGESLFREWLESKLAGAPAQAATAGMAAMSGADGETEKIRALADKKRALENKLAELEAETGTETEAG